MRTLMFILALTVGACQGRDPSPTSNDNIAVRKPVEAPDHDFVQERATYQTQARSRLERLNARISELGRDASVSLRAQRDQLAMEVEKIDERGESEWDTFRSKLGRSFDEVERAASATTE